ncbi:hypothetical protein RO575_00525 [Methylomonas sp. MO1]|uniref:hypothetical protein n=1 Tax=Methylomonas sp. MO1 TaxID=3073619 RepID=UPI0028A461B4|nr:hypothetical protein [Methylomonas sp. MO1]MDT4288036.1 hypothetical protein [Methylomonas sp. MO1]
MFVLSGVVLSIWSGLNEHVIPAWIAGIQKPRMAEGFKFGVATATAVLKSGLGPTAEILSFAWPKKKRPPHAAFILRAEGFERGFRKGYP